MSRPRIASSGSEVTSAASPSSRAFSANRSAVSRLRLYATTRSSAKRARSVHRFASAWVPQATKPTERLWGLASTVAATAVMDAVRTAVIQRPSRTANGSPVSVELRMSSGLKSGRPRPALFPM